MKVNTEPIKINTFKYGIAISSLELLDVIYNYLQLHSSYPIPPIETFVEKVDANGVIKIKIKPDIEEIEISFD